MTRRPPAGSCHVVVSLLYLPIGDAKLEREMVQRSVAPAFESAR
jgi:hypothetical protein